MKPQLNPHTLRSKAFDASFKTTADDGTFSGYGSVFGNVDTYGEVVAPGAFTDSLARLKASGRTLPMLWSHNASQPIGNWIDLEQDAVGLKGVGQLWLKESPFASVAYKGMTTKSITGLSIGYYVKEWSYNEDTDVFTLEVLDVNEISPCISPANDEARVEVVKSKLARGEMPAMAEVEKYLREAGFSKSQATTIVSRGMKDFRSESEGKAGNPILTALRGFSL